MEIPLTQNKVAVIDDEDAPLVVKHKWHAHRTKEGKWYARRGVSVPMPCGGRKVKFVLMHREIVGAKPGQMVDHWNDDGLLNTRANIRPCTNAQNQQNTGARGGASRFKGVSWYGRYGKWKVAFNHDGKTHFVGYFTDEVAAARAYDAAILPLAGEFARPNAPEGV